MPSKPHVPLAGSKGNLRETTKIGRGIPASYSNIVFVVFVLDYVLTVLIDFFFLGAFFFQSLFIELGVTFYGFPIILTEYIIQQLRITPI